MPSTQQNPFYTPPVSDSSNNLALSAPLYRTGHLSSRLVPASKALVRDGEGSLATQCKVVPSQECKLFQVHKEVTWVTAKMPHSGF